MRFLDSSSWVQSALIVVVPSIMICLVGLWVVRRWMSHRELQANHEVAGFTLGIIGVLYSVVLGFTVVNVQTRYNQAQETIYAEALSIADLYREAGQFSEPSSATIRNVLRNYVTYVIEKEWETPKDEMIRAEGHNIMEKIYESYYQVDITDEKTKIWYQESINKLDVFMNARLSREFSSWDHLNGMMWTILIMGGIITICFMYFFGLEKLQVQMMMTALLSGYISFMLFLVYSLDNVYKGPEGIKPVAFEEVISLFDRWSHSK